MPNAHMAVSRSQSVPIVPCSDAAVLHQPEEPRQDPMPPRLRPRVPYQRQPDDQHVAFALQ